MAQPSSTQVEISASLRRSIRSATCPPSSDVTMLGSASARPDQPERERVVGVEIHLPRHDDVQDLDAERGGEVRGEETAVVAVPQRGPGVVHRRKAKASWASSARCRW